MNLELYWYDYLKILITIGSVLTLPGWALLVINQNWKKWATLQRWIIAIGLSIAFYPVLFYWARTVLPSFQIGPNKNLAILIACGVWVGWQLRKNWKKQFQFDRMEWLALLVIAGTLFTRYYIAYTHPFPAWSDSLHHTLITQLVGLSGRLPITLEPYAPTSLDMYHLGLYSLTGTVMQLAQVPAHTALVWTAQTLNGLCGLGVYLLLDRKVSRLGAITGAAVVGLFSHMPAWYVNWGRFTQVASQSILFIAWIITWEAIKSWKEQKTSLTQRIFWSVLAGMLNAAIFLLHFRVSVYYFPLLIFIIGIHILKDNTQHRLNVLIGVLVIGCISFILIFPAFGKFLTAYNSFTQKAVPGSNSGSYYDFSTAGIPSLIASTWLLVWTYICLAAIMFRRDRLGLMIVFWGFTLFGMGILYLFRIPTLSFTNLSGILIMFYLLIGVIIGIGTSIYYDTFIQQFQPGIVKPVFLGLLISIGFWQGSQRLVDVEEARYFISTADIQAMGWIETNTPQDAIFAVDTYKWLNSVLHGMDGGYWIPYFTQRRTTASTMLAPLARDEFHKYLITASNLVLEISSNPDAVTELCNMGIQFAFIGNKSYLPETETELRNYVESSTDKVIYNKDGVIISQLCSK